MIRRGWASYGQDWRLVLYYSGRVTVGFGLLMALPMLVGIAEADWYDACIFACSGGITVAVGYILTFISGRPDRPVQWIHGLVIAAVVWLLAMLLGALPYEFSGYYLSYLDAVFDVMSGLTTTGLSLIQHADRISDALNTWRFLLTYLGGQGIVVMALTFFVNESGAFKIYVGEAKDERLLPNVRSTARAIWRISLLYLVVGSAILFASLVIWGFPPVRAAWNAIWMFMSAWSTGGFAPHSSNILYYHDPIFEFAGISIAVIGSFNFAFHHALWQGRWKEIWRDLEFLTFVVTVNALWVLVAVGLIHTGTYTGIVELVRMGWINLISAHTTTGFSNIYPVQFPLEWGGLAFLAVVIAMLFGGSASSTAGGFKAIRVGTVFRGIQEDIRRLLMPESAVIKTHLHHIEDFILNDARVRGAALIILLYLATFGTGALVLTMYGYPLGQSLFEAASATGNVGLSSGVTSASMAPLVKVMFIGMMWVGRLEFLSVFVFVTHVVRGVIRR